jgi:hypothetical protein
MELTLAARCIRLYPKLSQSGPCLTARIFPREQKGGWQYQYGKFWGSGGPFLLEPGLASPVHVNALRTPGWGGTSPLTGIVGGNLRAGRIVRSDENLCPHNWRW